jgi:hypothetical protein
VFLATLSDFNFLPQGLALCESLTPPFTLFYLTLDDDSYGALRALNLPNIQPLRLVDIDDGSLTLLRSAAPSKEATTVGQATNRNPQEVLFFWALSSYLCSWLLYNQDIDHICYVDSDLCFYESQNVLLDKMENHSIGIVEHRIPFTEHSGKYNVGVVFFKGDITGLRAVDFWKGCLLDSNNKFAAQYGQCGDQKYLELFPSIWSERTLVFDTVGIGHLAPWNFGFHFYPWREKENWITYRNQRQQLFYIHFSNFQYDDNGYVPAPRHGVMNVFGFIKDRYDTYYKRVAKWKRESEKAV